MSEQQQNVGSEDEISLKDLILKFWEYFFYLIKRWKVIALFTALGLLLSLFNHFIHIPKHTATISFMINEDESSSLGGIGNLLGSFGGLLGGSSEYNLDKILEISKSDRIGERLLLKKAKVNNRNDYIANHIITNQDTLGLWLNVNWYKKPFTNLERKRMQRAFRFQNDTVDYTNITEAYILKKLYKKLFGAGGGIISTEFDELSGLMKIHTKSYDDSLSLCTTNILFEELSDFYIKKSVEKQQQTFDIMKMKHDSISSALSSLEYRLANFQDTNRGLFKASDQVKKSQFERDVYILSIALGEAKKNLEISDFALRNKMPFISVLDRPFLPLNSTKSSIFQVLFFGILIGCVIGGLFVICQKLYQDIMS